MQRIRCKREFGLTLLIGLLLSAIHPISVYAGAWPNKPGSGLINGSLSVEGATRLSDSHGEVFDYSLLSSAVNLYGEWHLSRRWCLGAFLTPGKYLVSEDGDQLGIGDATVSSTFYIGKISQTHFAFQGTTMLPLGTENSAFLPDSVYPIFGQGIYAFELRPQVGWTIGSYWFQSELAYRHRTEGRVPQGLYSLSSGHSFSKKWAGRLSLSGMFPLRSTNPKLPGDAQRYYGFQTAALYRISPSSSFVLQWDGMVTPGYELPVGPRLNFGYSYTWK